jgi:hypothetical protein
MKENQPTEYDAVLGGTHNKTISVSSYIKDIDYRLFIAKSVILRFEEDLLYKDRIKKRGGIKRIKERISYWKGRKFAYEEIKKILMS